MKIPPSTPNRCRQLLHQWRRSLVLSSFEKSTLAGAIKTMDSQLERLMKKRLRITVFGRVGVGKSSLLT